MHACTNSVYQAVSFPAHREPGYEATIQHASCIFIPISCILQQVLTHFRSKRLRSLQNKGGSFNHRVVTLVVDKLEKQY